MQLCCVFFENFVVYGSFWLSLQVANAQWHSANNGIKQERDEIVCFACLYGVAAWQCYKCATECFGAQLFLTFSLHKFFLVCYFCERKR